MYALKIKSFLWPDIDALLLHNLFPLNFLTLLFAANIYIMKTLYRIKITARQPGNLKNLRTFADPLKSAKFIETSIIT